MNIRVPYCMADDLTFVTVQYCLQNFESLRAEQVYLDDCGDGNQKHQQHASTSPLIITENVEPCGNKIQRRQFHIYNQ